jgi:rhamnosyltransferase
MEKVFAIINTFNPDMARLEEVIRAVEEQVVGVIITDNNSRPEARDSLRAIEAKFGGFVNIIWKPEDLGLGASLNTSARAAIERGADWILTLDDDSIPGTGMVGTLLEEYHTLPDDIQNRIGLLMPNEQTPKASAYPPNGPPKIHDDGGTTAGQVVRASILPTVGFWNEGLFIDTVDGEFCFRVRKHGFLTLLVPRVAIHTRPGHPVLRKFFGKTVSVPNYAPYRYYYMTRNLVYLYVRHFGTYVLHNKYWYRGFWAIIIPRFFIKMVLFENNRREKIPAAWHGLRDGLFGRLGKMPQQTKAPTVTV